MTMFTAAVIAISASFLAEKLANYLGEDKRQERLFKQQMKPITDALEKPKRWNRQR